MSLTINLKKKVHRKIWEALFTPLPVATAAGVVFVGDNLNLGDGNQGYYLTGVSACYQWTKGEEGFGQIPNSGSAGTWGIGNAGFVHPSGPTGTASAGSTSSFTTTLTIPRDLRGYRFRITGGTNKGVEGIIKNNTIGANSVINTVDTYGAAFDNTSVFLLLTNRLWLYVAGATSGFNYYDWATNAWTSRSVASGPAVTTGEGFILGSCAKEAVFETGTATAGGASTLTDAGRAWTPSIYIRCMVAIISGTGAGQAPRYITANTATQLTVDTAWGTQPDATSVYEISGVWSDVASAGNTTTATAGTGTPWTASQWIGYQIRVLSGTGAGQVSPITSNTTSVLTFTAVGTGLDATSRYVIEPDDNALYFVGGTAVTLFKYSISGNSWSTLTPGAARSVAPGAGASANFMADVKDLTWMGAGSAGGPGGVLKQNGRFIYSFRGAASGALDIYDIAANTWYSTVSYGGANTETFTTGATWADIDGFIYGQKDATGRWFRFDISKNEMLPINTNVIGQGAAIGGQKMVLDKYVDPVNGKTLRWIYWGLNTSAQLTRMLEV